jgi:hypothetical protein
MVEEDSNIFFQYRKVDTHTLEALENHELYFSNPSEFNDPFDSKLDLIWKGDITDWSRFFLNHGVNDPIEVRFLIKENHKKGILKKKGSDYLLNPHNKKFKTINKNLQSEDEDYPRICCFSKTKKNILLWSHYTNGHKGICLCFKSEKIGSGNFLILDSNPEILLPVNYNEKNNEELPKQVNMLSKYDPEELAAFLLTKHSLWVYEEEYRLILWDGFKDKFTKSFRKEDLEGIIFGIKTPIEDIKRIYDILKPNYLDAGIKVNFYKVQEMQDKYTIKIKKIDLLDKYLKKYNK